MTKLTQKEKAVIFDDCYNIYEDKFNENSEVGECAMAQYDFGKKLKEVIKNEEYDFD